MINHRSRYKYMIVVVVVCACLLFLSTLKFSHHLPCSANCTTRLANLSDLVLFVRMFEGKKHLYESILVQSMSYFWTLDIPLIAVLDKTKTDHAFGLKIERKYPFPRVLYEEPFNPKYYNNRGHALQQLSMFYAENHTNATYVGFVDTDTMFSTMVTPSMLFEEGKPIVIGQYGDAPDKHWYEASKMTEFALGIKETMRCMSYFPVIIKVQHLVEMRDYMSKKHKKDFKLVFMEFSKTSKFSQFSIMCNYVWYFHRGDYVFRLQQRSDNGLWKKTFMSPGRQPPEYYDKNFNSDSYYPIPRTSIHYRYTPHNEKQETFRNIIKAGLCYSGGFDLCPKVCTPYKRSDVNKNLYQFEYSDWTWDARCIHAQRKYLTQIRQLNQTEVKRRILKGCVEVHTLRHA